MEFAENAMYMVFDCRRLNPETRSDLFVAEALSQKLDDLCFAAR
jgi:hypothetical protein